MNCLEAQSKIMAFIENKLPDDELREFIKHVRSCKNCYEELDIHRTECVQMGGRHIHLDGHGRGLRPLTT